MVGLVFVVATLFARQALATDLPMALLIALTLYLAQKARLRAQDVEAVSQVLMHEIDERKQTEKLLETIDNLQIEILQRALVESQLRESQHQYQDLVDSLDGIIWEMDARSHQFTFVNKQCERVLGYSPEQWLNQFTWRDFIHPEDLDYALSTCKQAIEARRNFALEYRAIAADGRVVWLRDIATVTATDHGSVRLRGVLLDITQFKRDEETLTQLSRAVQQTASAVMITDRKGIIEYVNRAFEELTGYSKAEVMGKTPRVLKSGQHADKFYEEFWTIINSGRSFAAEFTNRKKDGQLYYQEQTITPIRNDQGNITHFVATGKDITERKQLEEQLRQSQKMEAIGQLAGGIAHDFNNLLTVITGQSDRLLQRVAPDDPLGVKIEEIRKAGQRAASLTRQLLAFSRRQVLQPRILNLNLLVIDLNKMLQRLISEDIELVTVLDPGLEKVKADPAQLEQIIVNLVVNARDAMPHGGRLSIESVNVELDQIYARRHLGMEAGHYVMLAVSDTGCGMDQETLSHIFEPFFTTKELGKGTGLGLAMIHGIVRQSGGHIFVYSEPAQGTTFKIYLPAARGSQEVTQLSGRAEILPQGTETILLVEDEEGLRTMTREILQESGYIMLEASCGAEALQICERYGGPIHLLLTDVVMPRMSGRELAKRVSSRYPELQVLYMSGYTDNVIAHHGVLDPDTRFISKPFTPDGLTIMVRNALDQT